MSNRPSFSGRVGGIVDNRRVTTAMTTFGKSLLFGAIAGMATFTYIAFQWAHPAVERWMLIGLMVVAGSANVWYVEDLRPGILTSILSVVIAFAIHVAAWTAPVFVTNYHPVVGKLLFLSYLGQAVTSALLVLPLAYYGGFFLALLYFSTIGY